jgi:hypothetical protein
MTRGVLGMFWNVGKWGKGEVVGGVWCLMMFFAGVKKLWGLKFFT